MTPSTSETTETKQQVSTPTRPSNGAIMAFIITLLVALGLDLGSKWLAFSNEPTKLFDSLSYDEDMERFEMIGSKEGERVVIPHVLNLKATTNQGAIFGAAQGKQKLLIAVSIAAIVVVGLMFFKSGPSRIERFLLALLLAGILGNLFDRITLEYVRDLFFLFPNMRWPGEWSLPWVDYPSNDAERLVFPYIFNFADVFLVCGVTIFVIRNLFFPPKHPQSEDQI